MQKEVGGSGAVRRPIRAIWGSVALVLVVAMSKEAFGGMRLGVLRFCLAQSHGMAVLLVSRVQGFCPSVSLYIVLRTWYYILRTVLPNAVRCEIAPCQSTRITDYSLALLYPVH